MNTVKTIAPCLENSGDRLSTTEMNMNTLAIFEFEGSEVRFVGTPDQPEWVAQDVCNVLDLGAASNSLRNFSPDEKDVCNLHTPGGEQQALTVTEPGLYRLIFKSRKPVAKRFRRWVLHEVLPSIRKTGRYEATSIQDTLALLNGLLDPLTTKGVDVALIQSAKISAIAIQHPEYKPMLSAAKESLMLMTPDEDRRCSPTKLGVLYAEQRGLSMPVQPRRINQALQEAGLQLAEYRTNSKGKRVMEWRLTEQGKRYGQVFLEAAQGSNKTLSVVRWLPSVLNAIQLS